MMPASILFMRAATVEKTDAGMGVREALACDDCIGLLGATLAVVWARARSSRSGARCRLGAD